MELGHRDPKDTVAEAAPLLEVVTRGHCDEGLAVLARAVDVDDATVPGTSERMATYRLQVCDSLLRYLLHETSLVYREHTGADSSTRRAVLQ